MGCCASTDLVIQQGKTFSRLLQYATSEITYKAITAITQAAPVLITVTGHGIPDGWRAAVTSVKGMTELNAENDPPKESDYRVVTVESANTISFNSVNAAGYSAYVSDGYVQFRTPVDLDGTTARMTIKDRIGGTALETLTSGAGEIIIDNTAKTIRILIAATATEDYTWTEGVYDLELEFVDGTIKQLLTGAVTVVEEVTT